MQNKISVWDLLQQSRNYDTVALLISNHREDKHSKYELIWGAGAKRKFSKPSELNGHDSWALGRVQYSHRSQKYFRVTHQNALELRKECFDFFEPEELLVVPTSQKLLVDYSRVGVEQGKMSAEFKCSTTQSKYLETVEHIKECIRNGVFYEMNYCIQYFSELNIDPYDWFFRLNEAAPSPFAAFYKSNGMYTFCASPERFLQKTGPKLLSQPIKGTRKRYPPKDEQDREELRNHVKDRAENVMIVDLVRNDLSMISKVGTVEVLELCEIYTFSHVHQMISTVVSEMEDGRGFEDILEATFPMGSMTGAPKIEVMKHIDALEDFTRQGYSGSIGYWYNGDFDLNVVIRGYEYSQGRLSYSVGGAITYDSDALQEWEECQTKASTVRSIYTSNL
jgi:para-aminobenzoate synthetase component 1